MFEPISELAEINPPLSASAPIQSGDFISFIPMSDVSESGQWLAYKTRAFSQVKSGFTPFQEGDVLFAKITPCMENGKGAQAVGLEKGIGYGSTEFHILRAKADNSPRYIFHLSQSSNLRLKAEASMIGSAGQKRVPSEFFRKHRVFAPIPAEQRLIARILDTLDTQIHKTEALIAKLEKVKEGLLHDLLTRGIDENGQLRPSPEQTPELYKESPLGVFPKDWSINNVASIGKVKGGKRLPYGHDYSSQETGFRYLRVTDFYEKSYFACRLESLEESTFNLLSRYEIQPGDAFVSIAGSIGYFGIHSPIDTEGHRVILTENAARIVLNSEIHPEYFAYAMNSETSQKQVEAETGTGGGVPKLALFRIEQILFPFPDYDEQKEIVKRAKSLSSRIADERLKFDKMKAQKQGLIEDLLTGRVRVTPLLEQAQATTPA